MAKHHRNRRTRSHLKDPLFRAAQFRPNREAVKVLALLDSLPIAGNRPPERSAAR